MMTPCSPPATYRISRAARAAHGRGIGRRAMAGWCTLALAGALLVGCATPPPGVVAPPKATPDVVTRPRLKSRPDVPYPVAAQRADAEGVVEIQLLHDAAGAVQRAELVKSSGHAELDQAALKAARQFVIEPGTRNGVPQAGRVQVPIRFKLVTDAQELPPPPKRPERGR